jgi:hypothetical protein
MAISNVEFNKMLDLEFYRSGGATVMRLYDSADTLIDSETVYFSQASGGSTEVENVVFAVPSGKTVDYITLYNGTLSDVFETAEVTNETFTSNGTYTINLFRKTLEG